MTDLTILANTDARKHLTLLEQLRNTEAVVRRQPTAPEHRWALVEILCQLHQWERALQQLQAWVKLAPQRKAQAHLVRGLIQAETQRVGVFSGQAQAAPVLEFTPWMQDMAMALKHNAMGAHDQADICRTRALEEAPTRAGLCRWDQREHAHQTPTPQTYSFPWLSDSDTRLGPICEIVVAGAYRWLAFSDIATLSMEEPKGHLDLVWTPVRIQLLPPQQSNTDATGRELHAYLPTRSCWVQPPAEPTEQQQALMQANLTLWQEVGRTGVFVQGQKTWMSDSIDWPLLDIREVRT